MAKAPLSVFDGPRCLISCNESGQFEIAQDVLSQIRKIKTSLQVVGVAGRYRTGKSFLMNRLNSQNSGFPLGPTVQAETKGIWVWVKKHPTRPGKYLVLLDTEGLGDVEKGDPNHDVKVFSLAMLLSSVLVYNITGVIGSDEMNFLSFITELSKHVQVRTTGTRHGAPKDAFPDFIFAIRDFTLEKVVNGREVSSVEYLEHCLKSGANEQANRTKDCIKQCFPRRNCFTFVWPAQGKQLKELDKLKETDLDEDFLKETTEFCHFILTEGSEKKLNGETVDGNLWAGLIEHLVHAKSQGRIPDMQNALDSLAATENPKAIKKAMVAYNSKMAALALPTKDMQTLEFWQSQAETAATNEFQQASIFDFDQKYLAQLRRSMQQEKRIYVSKNETESIQKCRRKISELESGSGLSGKLSSGSYLKIGGHQEFMTDFSSVVRGFRNDNTLGVKAAEELNQYSTQMNRKGEEIRATDIKLTNAEDQRKREVQRQEEAERARRDAERRKQEAEQRAREVAEREKQLQEEARIAKLRQMERMVNAITPGIKARLNFYKK